MQRKFKILVVDDEDNIRFAIRNFLEASGYDVVEGGNCSTAEETFHLTHPDAAIIDYSLPDGTALNLLERFKKWSPSVPVLVLTAYGTIQLAVTAIKQGAENFLTKPVELPTLLLILQRSLDNQRSRRRDLAQRSRQDRNSIDPFVGTSDAIRRLEAETRKVALADSPVLITGETGTGKGILAAWLHSNSSRADEAFVDLNCAGLSRDLLETELFGHEKGAFTGAVKTKLGLLEIADRGTVFLDEIGDMDLQVQPKVLKVVEEKNFRRVGDLRPRLVDIRLVAATHHDVGKLVREERFREDLYFRISTLPLNLPPLRMRTEDLPAIAMNLLRASTEELSRDPVSLSPGAIKALQSYAWPGNIRELRNVLERAILLTEKRVLNAEDFRFESGLGRTAHGLNTNLTLQEAERRHIESVLQEENWHVERAASRLGLSRSSLYERIKKLGIRQSMAEKQNMEMIGRSSATGAGKTKD